MTAEIIQLRDRRCQLDSKVLQLEVMMREVERLELAGQLVDLPHLLTVTEILSNRLMDLSCLLLDCKTRQRLLGAFDELTARITQARQVMTDRNRTPTC